jgi:hypothetical protein
MALINNTEATIDTVAPALNIGELQLSADRRGKELADHERIRRVVLPAGHWGELTAGLQTYKGYEASQGLTDVLREALRDIANARLRDILAETPQQRTVALADFTVGALLAWNADTASSRGSITFTREQVEAWYPASAIGQQMKQRGTAFVEFVGKRLAALAAKNHGLKKPEEATKLIVLLEADASTALGAELIQRLTHIEKSLTQRANEETISMDAL